MLCECSIVIAARNAESTIGACISSLLSQSLKPLEIIVVDNASTDSTARIASSMGIKVVYEPIIGRSRARNRGIEESKGRFIAFIDADAVADKDWLLFLMDRYKAGDCSGVAGRIRALNSEKLFAKLLELSSEGRQHFGGCNIMYERDVLIDVGMFDEKLKVAEDVELAWRVIKSGRSIAYEPKAVVYHAYKSRLIDILKQQYEFGMWTVRARKKHGMPCWKQKILPFASPILFFRNLKMLPKHPMLPFFTTATSFAYGLGALKG